MAGAYVLLTTLVTSSVWCFISSVTSQEEASNVLLSPNLPLCSNSPCGPQGTCADLTKKNIVNNDVLYVGFKCICPAFHTGKFCESILYPNESADTSETSPDVAILSGTIPLDLYAAEDRLVDLFNTVLVNEELVKNSLEDFFAYALLSHEASFANFLRNDAHFRFVISFFAANIDAFIQFKTDNVYGQMAPLGGNFSMHFKASVTNMIDMEKQIQKRLRRYAADFRMAQIPELAVLADGIKTYGVQVVLALEPEVRKKSRAFAFASSPIFLAAMLTVVGFLLFGGVITMTIRRRIHTPRGNKPPSIKKSTLLSSLALGQLGETIGRQRIGQRASGMTRNVSSVNRLAQKFNNEHAIKRVMTDQKQKRKNSKGVLKKRASQARSSRRTLKRLTSQNCSKPSLKRRASRRSSRATLKRRNSQSKPKSKRASSKHRHHHHYHHHHRHHLHKKSPK